jgi:hypothetical protein
MLILLLLRPICIKKNTQKKFMKSLKPLSYFTMVIFLLCACQDESSNSFLLDFDGTKTGAYLRQVTTSAKFSKADMPGSFYAITLEAYAGTTGDQFTSVDLFVKFNGANISRPEVLLKNIGKEEFSRNAISNLLRTEFGITGNETLAALSLSQTDIAKGDIVEFRQSINLPDGRSYSFNNSSSVLSQPFYNSPFVNNITVTD